MKSTSYVEFLHPPSLSGLTGVPQDRDTTITSKSKTSGQPPTSTHSPLRTHLEQLRNSAQKTIHTLPPNQANLMSDRIRSWVYSMSPEQRTRRFSVDEVERLAGLVGKHGGRAAHHHIAHALRTSGFQPCRDWTISGRNKRFWKFSGEMK
jgi:hypothetical protein